MEERKSKKGTALGRGTPEQSGNSRRCWSSGPTSKKIFFLEEGSFFPARKRKRDFLEGVFFRLLGVFWCFFGVFLRFWGVFLRFLGVNFLKAHHAKTENSRSVGGRQNTEQHIAKRREEEQRRKGNGALYADVSDSSRVKKITNGMLQWHIPPRMVADADRHAKDRAYITAAFGGTNDTCNVLYIGHYSANARNTVHRAQKEFSSHSPRGE